ncbi:carboxylesterase/lipase family protein [Sphingobium sp. TKS]|uniref:carboxylesterase/lipase family protein n=1 Tax=Sphingobium sp. TKS TaxID=1315974 RepID=UPI00077043DA|nr:MULTISPECIES: carboxylesterase family protein [Sphingomonadaceae]AMK25443.1 para-nitrobenzyl esterase PnbA [Sphingobium sp. TKS]
MLDIETTHGPIRGERIDMISVFRGIPFAAPPVGPRRWRPPAPPEAWTAPRDATRFGADCPQRTAIPIGSRASEQSEDCLTLNVWTPAARPNEGLPVMVWIFGGSFQFGSGAEERADGMTFARDGVIYVSINYRTGMFGFLAHPQLTAESKDGSSGNYGLLDQIAGLRWVRENIVRFGGDPDRVTLFGVSASAASISPLMTSPLAQGLFQQVILQSPGAFRRLASLADAEKAGAALDADIAALLALSAEDLLDRQTLIEPAVRSLTAPRILRLIRDSHVVPADDRDSFLGGRFAHVPAIGGCMEDEGSNAVATWPVRAREDFAALLDRTFGEDAAQGGQAYPVASDDDVAGALGDLFGDTRFTYGVAALSRVFAGAGVPVWRYAFTRRRPGKGAPKHSEDVSYVFDRPELPPRGESDHCHDATDTRIAAAMHAAWVTFAKTGAPGSIEWPRYAPGTMSILEFGDSLSLRTSWPLLPDWEPFSRTDGRSRPVRMDAFELDGAHAQP